jgi:hypothetical protein
MRFKIKNGYRHPPDFGPFISANAAGCTGMTKIGFRYCCVLSLGAAPGFVLVFFTIVFLFTAGSVVAGHSNQDRKCAIVRLLVPLNDFTVTFVFAATGNGGQNFIICGTGLFGIGCEHGLYFVQWIIFGAPRKDKRKDDYSQRQQYDLDLIFHILLLLF